MKKNYLVLLIFIGFIPGLSAQNRYFVYLKDKNNSEYSVSDPEKFLSPRALLRRKKQDISVTERDLPPSGAYLKQIKDLGFRIVYTSRWLNAALVEGSSSHLNELRILPCIKDIEGNGDIRGYAVARSGFSSRKEVSAKELPALEYGASRQQIEMLGAGKMHQKGFTGKGVLIGVLDSGFRNADRLSFFSRLFSENRVIDTYDFVQQEKSVFEDDAHGTAVLSCMAASENGRIIGTAPDASYVLLRTEDVNSETRIEEVYWLKAAEYCDSIGVDVINSSLGYNYFDNSSQNYSYQDMNGDKSIIARAADLAVAAGIVVVTSAGNEGNKSWRYITTPADADSVISVGAVDGNAYYAYFSSIGPNAKGHVKPELVSRGSGSTVGTYLNSVSTSNGTSFSSPLLAGMVAGFRQAFPDLKAMEIRDFMIRSGSQYSHPDIYLGYGIPDFEKASELAARSVELSRLKKELDGSDKEIIVFPNPVSDFSDVSVYVRREMAPGSQVKVSILDQKGAQIWNYEEESGFFRLPSELSGLPAGTYQIRVYNSDFSASSRIIKY